MPSDKHNKPGCDQIIDILPNPFVVIDRDYRIVAANRPYCQHYGLDREEVVGRLCHEVSHHSKEPCSRHGEHCPLDEVFGSGKPTEVLHVHCDHRGGEEHVQLQCAPIKDEDGHVLYMGSTSIPCVIPI